MGEAGFLGAFLSSSITVGHAAGRKAASDARESAATDEVSSKKETGLCQRGRGRGSKRAVACALAMTRCRTSTHPAIEPHPARSRSSTPASDPAARRVGRAGCRAARIRSHRRQRRARGGRGDSCAGAVSAARCLTWPDGLTVTVARAQQSVRARKRSGPSQSSCRAGNEDNLRADAPSMDAKQRLRLSSRTRFLVDGSGAA